MKKQKGLSLVGFIILAAIVGFVMFTAFRCVPAWTEYFSLKKVLQSTANQFSVDATPTAIRSAFDKRNSIEDLPVRGTDLEISKDNGRINLSVNYARKVHIAGNTSLLFDFEASASGNR
ncbi:MAG: DUF4845 domain-containing protein [Burkholderiales bacterium]|nr:MAG: DUF4845 domain-containing protein [Burkholderiales bacterium]TAG80813.1 MAG: DUF4845 domain-containing protein [Betaproteobacteria bacterium]